MAKYKLCWIMLLSFILIGMGLPLTMILSLRPGVCFSPRGVPMCRFSGRRAK